MIDSFETAILDNSKQLLDTPIVGVVKYIKGMQMTQQLHGTPLHRQTTALESNDLDTAITGRNQSASLATLPTEVSHRNNNGTHPQTLTNADSPVIWDASATPDLTGRTMIVTGASSGLGLLLTRHLAAHGATVIMAIRDTAKGEGVRQELLKAHPGAALELWPLDLLDLDSVRRFAAAVAADGRPIDALINNAGIGNQPRRLSPQGYESQFATNLLSHYALTGLLLGSLARGHDPRVISVGSNLYRRIRRPLNFANLNGERSYSPGGAYIQSKLANILFGQELERRLRAIDSPVRSLVAHPGMATTPMHQHLNSAADRLLMKVMTALLARPAEQGVVPLLYATVAPQAPVGLFIGPTGPKDRPKIALDRYVGPATDDAAARRLWDVAGQMTGVRYLDR